MAKSDKYPINISSPVQVTRELYTNVGALDNIVGDYTRAIYGGTDFEIWDSAVAGTQLTEGVDYELTNLDQKYTERAGQNVYKSYKITNVTYQTGNIYITYKTIGTVITTNIITDINTQLASLGGGINSITTNYTILDSDGYGTIQCDPTAGDITVTLPTAADNTNRQLKISVSTIGGKVTVDGEGAETINGNLTQAMQNQYDYIDLYCDGTEWIIISSRQTIDTGWVNRSVYTTIKHGSTPLTYDNLSGTYTLGERVKEFSDVGRTTPTGVEGVIQSDTGSVLKLKNVVGGGIFTNNYYLQGDTSGATSDVNEVAGSNKNTNSDILHDFDQNLYQLRTTLFGSTDGTENNSFEYIWQNIATTEFGWNPLQTDTNNLTIQTGGGGLVYKPTAGAAVVVDTEDWYIRSITEVK